MIDDVIRKIVEALGTIRPFAVATRLKISKKLSLVASELTGSIPRLLGQHSL